MIFTRNGPLRLFAVAVLAALILMSSSSMRHPAKAWCYYPCDVEWNSMQMSILNGFLGVLMTASQEAINAFVDDSFDRFHTWMGEVYFKEHWGLAMIKMTEEFSGVAMQQMVLFGGYLDAKHQLETVRLYQQLAAQAHKDYYPSEGLCAIGSVARNLGGSDRNGELTALALSRRSQQRQLMTVNSVGAQGVTSDYMARVQHFITSYCDKNDNNGQLNGICNNAVPNPRKNRDVDFVRTLWSPMSLNANFNNAGLNDDEADLLALQSNLYGARIFNAPISAAKLRYDTANPLGNIDNLNSYLDMRSIVAKRSVAENSFQALAGMKSAGSNVAGTAQFIQAAIKELNPSMSDAQAAQIAGSSPSYDAQMEILTKKLLQNPQFYTDLYDKPANVERKRVALQAIGMIQERDNYKSALRSEAMWSILLELAVVREQEEVQKLVDSLK